MLWCSAETEATHGGTHTYTPVFVELFSSHRSSVFLSGQILGQSVVRSGSAQFAFIFFWKLDKLQFISEAEACCTWNHLRAWGNPGISPLMHTHTRISLVALVGSTGLTGLAGFCNISFLDFTKKNLSSGKILKIKSIELHTHSQIAWGWN